MLYKLSCYLCKSYGVMITLVYGMYVHIKVVTYITFPNKQDFLPTLIRQKYKWDCQTRMYSCCMPL